MDKDKVLEKIRELMDNQHKKMDGLITSSDLKNKSEGFIEALYQVESLIINWGKE